MNIKAKRNPGGVTALALQPHAIRDNVRRQDITAINIFNNPGSSLSYLLKVRLFPLVRCRLAFI